MKNPADWNEADLNGLVTMRAEENVNLEFKRAEALENMEIPTVAETCKTDISKDVSAFANSAGGILIYGIEEEASPPHQARALSPIDLAKCSKERLEQVINSRIQPRIQGLLVHPIALSQTSPAKVAYVVQIPQSFTAHQAYDKRYYKRFNFQSVPMEDYEIRQAMNRARRPTYDITLVTSNVANELYFYPTIQNTSEIVGHEVSILLLIPKGLSKYPNSSYGTEDIGDLTYVRGLSERGLVQHVHPFATVDGSFRDAVKVSSPPPSLNFPVIVRVYDQFGEALEAQFTISFVSSPLGLVIDKTLRSWKQTF